MISLLEEIVSKYNVDGIQLDYIRYPFQKPSYLMGFNPAGRQKFEIESGLKLDKIDSNLIKTWNIWKAKQVSRFVQEASVKLQRIKPDIKISAAVFGGDRESRMTSIQQEWELWTQNGWVDILNPMIYASNNY
ncbi:MAG: family 10 glycosylhydrolase [Desulfobacterales bacterium]|nr:family 10 glycosylhydrolase [Desulfobacterales bacterium]